ncbi:MAG: hypothetical protein JST82_05665 [Bacteroidetes bacterium]|nr:hypothetical protein [Bacteroidota bacterium]
MHYRVLLIMIMLKAATIHAQGFKKPVKLPDTVSYHFMQKTSFSKPVKIPQNLLTQKLPFFCRQELLVEKKIKLPLKVRLGSKQDCDYLEQKTTYRQP